MRKLIFDAGPLITACRFVATGQIVIDHLLASCDITIASSVRDEVVVSGKRYPDAKIAQQRINESSLRVLSPSASPNLEAVIAIYGLGQGEQDSILLTQQDDLLGATLVLDDHLAYKVQPRETVMELVALGFETLLQERYQRYRHGEISLGRLAQELGVTSWELTHLLESHGWPVYNLPEADK